MRGARATADRRARAQLTRVRTQARADARTCTRTERHRPSPGSGPAQPGPCRAGPARVGSGFDRAVSCRWRIYSLSRSGNEHRLHQAPRTASSKRRGRGGRNPGPRGTNVRPSARGGLDLLCSKTDREKGTAFLLNCLGAGGIAPTRQRCVDIDANGLSSDLVAVLSTRVMITRPLKYSVP